jgi:hypothetical protein
MTCTTASFGACGMRVARLGPTGIPTPGANNLYETGAPIEVKATWNVKSGNRFEQRNGCGGVCTVVQQQDDIQGLTLAMTLCQLDAELMEMLTGGSVISVGGNSLGHMVPPLGQQQANGVSFEIWTQAQIGGAQATQYPYIHWVYPRVTWRAGDETFNEGILNVPFTGVCYENPNYEDGILEEWPTNITAIRAWMLDTALPPSLCGYQTLAHS